MGLMNLKLSTSLLIMQVLQLFKHPQNKLQDFIRTPAYSKKLKSLIISLLAIHATSVKNLLNYFVTENGDKNLSCQNFLN
jgi:hypothetical protein